MKVDPFESYRRSRATNVLLDEDESARSYVAFVPRDNSPFLEIRLSNGDIHFPQNICLINAVSLGKGFTHGVIRYTFMDVYVRGRNLRDLLQAVNHKRAKIIQPYDGEQWPDLPDKAAPFIESIKVKEHSDSLPDDQKNTSNL